MMTAELEDTVKKEESKYGFRRFLADTFAITSYGTFVNGSLEYFIVGLTFEQTAESRGMNALINLPLGRPYGKYRDFVWRKLKTDENSGFLRKIAADIASVISFWIPVYAAVLYTTGADHKQVLSACATTTVINAFMGRPIGWYLDTVRSFFGVKPEYTAVDK